MEIIKVDEKGRIIIPKIMREKIGIKEGSYVKIKMNEKSIIIEPPEPIADKYYGAFKIAEWPEDLDEFIIEVMRKWWTLKST